MLSDGQTNAASITFLLGKASKQIGLIFSRFPAFSINSLVLRPCIGIKMGENFDANFLRFALERGAHSAWALGPIFGETAAVYRQDVVFIALSARDFPAHLSECALETAC